ncbi:hypothetical protein NQ315_004566 [Exocentrus adspersus]|uniref:t-SNARE coiled-coil homology domain-containing protein n=1 Tax=Exocentrus adspersus TaxID=1586481 RepID=A0AAV8VNC8_9CUCU|nr:hypothetical protein NQ315_004566 [Exocentrus adspersus]
MALLFLEEDPWLTEYDSCEKLYRDIMEQLTLRQKYPRTSDKYSQLSANIRLRLKQFNNEVGQLNQKLEVISKTGNITPEESERRTRQIETLHSKAIKIKKVFEDQVKSKLEEDRYQISRAEQERGLGDLSEIISRQKNIAHTISNEVEFQNDILDDIGNQMEQTNERVRTETQHVDVVHRKDKTCIYWVTIILLFISIVVVALI